MMSFCRYKKIIEDGDTVVIYLSPKQMYPIRICPTETYQTRFGAIRLDELIGKPYGCKIQCSKGFVHILDITPELWTMMLPHRTQILYGPDISFILMNLEIKSGSTMVEAGTGSGSLSHCIARTIAPNGRLFTFDFHEERVSAARMEFAEHGLSEIIHIQHRDVCHDGFGELPGCSVVDAVFLDLPHPWEAIESVRNILKSGGRICCFSPCIEQVQRSCQTMVKSGFLDVQTYEIVLRPYEVRQMPLKTVQTSVLMKSNDEDEESNNNNNNNNDGSDQSQDFESKDQQESQCKRIRTEDSSGDNGKPNENNNSNEINYWVTYMNSEIAGHTGFLTFATKFGGGNPNSCLK